ncbi:hypothetical protein CGLAU_08675 [Corynebacterium glaucum]|uniref:Uncharacterized protein n=1 Tax=Corynebacterium glaucum TaxID=187491 RepID=A0A1Q2HY43_9CORY|nr:hypothetical protein [Corynebacterium glaucum]AQQ15690.1 hypothetical protein CGLAU_08675 [Corynebacterium glaucum]
MTTRAIPESVTRRKRRILFTDVAFGFYQFALITHFFQPGISNVLWILSGLVAAFGTIQLRRSIGGADLPDAELDEYELTRHLEAREDGLKTSLVISTVLFVITGFLAIAAKLWFEPTGADVAIFFGKAICFQLAFVPFAVARSLAGKINRDELISAG